MNILLTNNIISKKSEVRYEPGLVEGAPSAVVSSTALDLLMSLNSVNPGRCKS